MYVCTLTEPNWMFCVYYGLLDLVVRLMIILSCCSITKECYFGKLKAWELNPPHPPLVFCCSILIIVTYPGFIFSVEYCGRCAMGNCYSLQKDHETALKNFQRAVQLNPRFAYAHTLCGHEYEHYSFVCDTHVSTHVFSNSHCSLQVCCTRRFWKWD